MYNQKIKVVPQDAISCVDLMPHNQLAIGAAHIKVDNPQSISLFVEDIRGFMVELNFNLEKLIELKRILEDGTYISKAPIKIRSVSLSKQTNTVSLNIEKSLYVNTDNMILNYNKLLDDAERQDNLFDLGGFYVSHNREFIIFASINTIGNEEDDIQLVYVTTLISALTKIQSEYLFNSLELAVMSFNFLSGPLMVNDPTVVHHGMSVIMYREDTIQIVHSQIMNLFNSNREVNRLRINKVYEAMQMFSDSMNNYDYACFDKVQYGGIIRGSETSLKIIPSYHSNCRPLVIYRDCCVKMGKGLTTYYKYDDRIHETCEFGRGNPLSLIRNFYMDALSPNQSEPPRQSKGLLSLMNRVKVFSR